MPQYTRRQAGMASISNFLKHNIGSSAETSRLYENPDTAKLTTFDMNSNCALSLQCRNLKNKN